MATCTVYLLMNLTFTPFQRTYRAQKELRSSRRENDLETHIHLHGGVNTVVPRHLPLICSGTRGECRNRRVLSKRCIFFCAMLA